jgi:hypothetical protein
MPFLKNDIYLIHERHLHLLFGNGLLLLLLFSEGFLTFCLTGIQSRLRALYSKVDSS